MFCTNCGASLAENAQFCVNCGQPIGNAPKAMPATTQTNEKKLRCLPSFILGLIGSIFGMFGGICTTMCSLGNGDEAFLLIVGGSVIGLIGACLCLNKAKLGSVLETVGAILIIIRAFTEGSDFMSVIAFIFLLISGIIGLAYSFIPRRK